MSHTRILAWKACMQSAYYCTSFCVKEIVYVSACRVKRGLINSEFNTSVSYMSVTTPPICGWPYKKLNHLSSIACKIHLPVGPDKVPTSEVSIY